MYEHTDFFILFYCFYLISLLSVLDECRPFRVYVLNYLCRGFGKTYKEMRKVYLDIFVNISKHHPFTPTSMVPHEWTLDQLTSF